MVIKRMKYFVTVVDKMSYTEAAEALFVSQSAISQQILALEEEFGVKLLKRQGRGFVLTPAGDHFYRRCKSILEQIEATVFETIRIGSDDESRLRVGCLNLYEGPDLWDTVLYFGRTYPNVLVSVTSGNHDELYRRLLNGELDLVLNDQRRAFSDEFENYELALAQVMVNIPEGFPHAKEDYVDVEELKGLGCILISSRGNHSTDEAFYRDIIGFPGSFLYAESSEEARMLVAAGRGFLPFEGIGKTPPAMKGTLRLPLCRNGNPIRHCFCAFWQKERSGYYIEEFAATLKAHIEAS